MKGSRLDMARQKADLKAKNRALIITTLMLLPDLKVSELMYETNLCQRTVQIHMKEMHSLKMVHISSWTKNVGHGGAWAAHYSLGPGKDAVLRKLGKRGMWDRNNLRQKFKRDCVKMGSSNNPFAAVMAQL